MPFGPTTGPRRPSLASEQSLLCAIRGQRCEPLDRPVAKRYQVHPGRERPHSGTEALSAHEEGGELTAFDETDGGSCDAGLEEFG